MNDFEQIEYVVAQIEATGDVTAAVWGTDTVRRLLDEIKKLKQMIGKQYPFAAAALLGEKRVDEDVTSDQAFKRGKRG
jgi:hypothetical protein